MAWDVKDAADGKSADVYHVNGTQLILREVHERPCGGMRRHVTAKMIAAFGGLLRTGGK